MTTPYRLITVLSRNSDSYLITARFNKRFNVPTLMSRLGLPGIVNFPESFECL